LNNEFVKVFNESKAVLLQAAMQRKQQRCAFDILVLSKQSCIVSGMVYVNAMQRMQLSGYRTNSIIQWVLCTKNNFLNSEFNDRVLLFDTVAFVELTEECN